MMKVLLDMDTTESCLGGATKENIKFYQNMSFKLGIVIMFWFEFSLLEYDYW